MDNLLLSLLTMLAVWVLVVSVLLGVVSGVMIGSIGVGGIILVPCLIELPIAQTDDERVTTAVASCMFSYIFVGLAGSCAYARKNSVSWASTVWLVVGAVPGGVAGAVTVSKYHNL